MSQNMFFIIIILLVGTSKFVSLLFVFCHFQLMCLCHCNHSEETINQKVVISLNSFPYKMMSFTFYKMTVVHQAWGIIWEIAQSELCIQSLPLAHIINTFKCKTNVHLTDCFLPTANNNETSINRQYCTLAIAQNLTHHVFQQAISSTKRHLFQ